MPDEPQISPELAQALLKAQMVDEILGHPTLKPKLLRLVKEYNPAVPIPELDIPDALTAQLDTERKERQKLEARLTERDASDLRSTEERAAVESGVITDADVAEVRKFAAERGITKFDTAAEHYSLQRRSAEPRRRSTLAFEMPGSKDFKLLWSNPSQWARREAESYLSGRR